MRLDAATVSRVRLSPSPVLEVMSWLELAAAGERHPLFGDPGPVARAALRHPDVALIAAVTRLSRYYCPDLLTPSPAGGTWSQALLHQLDLVRETPSDVVVGQLQFGCPDAEAMPAGVRRSMESDGFARRAANGLRYFWNTVLADQRYGLEEAASTDIGRRSHIMATRGVGHLFGSLNSRTRWTGTELRIDSPSQLSLSLVGTELVLTPSVLTWPYLQMRIWNLQDASIAYPVGPGPAGRQTQPQPLASLLGSSRALILSGLGAASSTTDLADRHDLAVSTISHHLGVLLNAGLVSRQRKGRTVEYRRTNAGDTLIQRTIGVDC